MEPRPDGIADQEAPHGGGGDGGHHAPSDQLPGDLDATPSRQRHTGDGRKLAGKLFGFDRHGGAERHRAAGPAVVRQAGQPLLAEPLPPSVDDLRAGVQPSGDLVVGQPLGCQEHHLGSDDLAVRIGVCAGSVLPDVSLLGREADLEGTSGSHRHLLEGSNRSHNS